MKLIVISMTALVAASAAFAQKNKSAAALSDPIKLSEMWDDEELYYKPAKPNSDDWNGVVYLYASKNCFQLSQKPKAKTVESKKTVCEKSFEQNALQPYEKFSDFQKYKEKFLKCLDSADQKCLRPLISKTAKFSFGSDTFADRRDSIFKSWKAEDYKRVSTELRKGVVTEGDYKRFPPQPDQDGFGYRGHFLNRNGSWVLQSFLAGD